MTQDAQVESGQVLSTLNADGSRRWLRPRLSPGRFLVWRRVVAYVLIAVFTIVPYLTINGVPLLRLDIIDRRFSFFGHTFLATDTALMAVIFIGLFFSIFLITAILGRVWCGWVCPQTVYMEFLYRPIERLLEGAPGKKRDIEKATGARKIAKLALYVLASLFLAHTFLAYFVGPAQLYHWVQGSPINHPAAFVVMGVTTGLMLFDFAYFREQVCTVACPYGRLQSVMLDDHSLIITYDETRGEPRGKQKRRMERSASGDVHLKVTADKGDCIDCVMCVNTCPTGIDIREGLQMECIACAQCIDACDAVMEKIGKPRGLIRYSSQAIMEGKARSIMRPRLFFYPVFLVALGVVFFVLMAGRQDAEVRILPRQGATFYTLPSGEIANQVRLRIVNRSHEAQQYMVSLEGTQDARIISEGLPVALSPDESADFGFIVALPLDPFIGTGETDIELKVSDGKRFEKELKYRVLGPASSVKMGEDGADETEHHEAGSADADSEEHS